MISQKIKRILFCEANIVDIKFLFDVGYLEKPPLQYNQAQGFSIYGTTISFLSEAAHAELVQLFFFFLARDHSISKT